MKKIISGILIASMAVGIIGCQKPAEQAPAGELNILTWDGYVPGDVVSDFETETGIKVNYANFSTNEEMMSKLEATNAGQYDIVICSDYIIDVMGKQGGFMAELDKSKIPNIKNVDPNFMGKYYDPENKYSIPYAAGCALIVYDKAKTGFDIKSYKDLWNPELKNSIVILDGARDIIGMTLQMLGYSVNETDPEILAEAGKALAELKPNIIGFNGDTPHEMLISGEATVGFMFGSQATAAMDAVPTIEFAYPEEGMAFYIDNVIVPANAPNPDNANTFINYILDGKVSAKISSLINYINCNTDAKEYLPQEYIENKTVNIPSEELEKAEVFMDIGDASQIQDRIWTEFKSQ